MFYFLSFDSLIQFRYYVEFRGVVRSAHAVGASVFLFRIIVHIGRRLYMGSYSL